MARITIEECIQRMQSIIHNIYNVPKTKNKGNAGHQLEKLLGIPHSSECLDCSNGEIKAFPLKKLKSGQLVPKETIAVTMCSSFQEEFDDSRVCKKLSNTLFVPYMWNNDGSLIFYKSILFTPQHLLWERIREDYNLIKQKASENILKSEIGTYLQTRTKGAGHGTTSRAFYLRPKFTKELFNDHYL